MIEGHVDSYRHPIIKIVVAGSRSERIVDAFVDTCFDGEVCIPTQIAVQLGLELYYQSEIELADGTIKQELVFRGIVKLGDEEFDADIMLKESGDALLGNGLLEGKQLCVDYRNNTVKIL